MEHNSTDDFFRGLFKPKLRKTFVMSISIILSLVSIVLCYSVIWYERFGLDVKRTIVNQLFSQLCWTGIGIILMMTLPEWFRFLSGPLPEQFCWLHTVIKNSVIAKVLYLQTGLILVRYALIFWLKNPFAFKDDFWCCFINLWCNVFSVWPHFIFTFLPGRHPIGYYICIGHDPAEDDDQPKKFNYINFVFGYSSLVLHIIISLRIFLHKKKVSPLERSMAPTHRVTSSEKISLSSFTTLTTSLALIVALGFIFMKYSSIEPNNYSRFPDYLMGQRGLDVGG